MSRERTRTRRRRTWDIIIHKLRTKYGADYGANDYARKLLRNNRSLLLIDTVLFEHFFQSFEIRLLGRGFVSVLDIQICSETKHVGIMGYESVPSESIV